MPGSITRTLECLVLFAVFIHAARSTFWETCGGGDETQQQMAVSDVTLSPDRIARGHQIDLIVEISVRTAFIRSGTLGAMVFYGPIKVCPRAKPLDRCHPHYSSPRAHHTLMN